MFSSSFFATEYFNEYFKAITGEPILIPAYRHIWPAEYDPLVINGLVVNFYLEGIPFKLDVIPKYIDFWISSLNTVMNIGGKK